MQAVESANVTSMETQLARTGQDTVSQAKALAIIDTTTYATAAEFLRGVKSRMKVVTDYWSGPKSKAKAAHQEIVNKEKAMLAPLTEAEAIVKKSMGSYQQLVETQRRQAEEQAREFQRQEAARLLQDAIQAEGNGDSTGAEMAMAMAQVVEDMPSTPVSASPKADGISARKTWKARVVDPAKVPIEANGVLIRPVDLAALNSIARLTKGTSTIPGVEFYEESTISARA